MKVQDALNLLGLSGTVTKQEIRKAYKAASLKYHPDRNPAGQEMMQAINEAWATLKDLDEVTANPEAESYDYGQELNDALNAIIILAGLDIEICGNWVWVGGDTRTHKEELKAAGYKWAKKKAKWYYRPAEWRSRGRGNWDMDKIRDEHGSNKIKSRYRTGITA